MLEIKNLYSGYDGRDVIKNISLRAERGETLCIAGPNGCGKSTLLKAIARILDYRGTAAIDGRELASFTRRDLAKKIALLSQSSQVYFPYTVYDTVALGRYVHTEGFFKNLSGAGKAKIAEIIQALNLEDIQSHHISELSGGQLQRVFLARTLAQDPEIVLLDEPTSHLDLKHQADLLSYLTAWAKQHGRTVIGVFHDLNLVQRFGDTVAVMNCGEITAQGKPEQVLDGARLREIYGMDIRAFMLESLALWEKTQGGEK